MAAEQNINYDSLNSRLIHVECDFALTRRNCNYRDTRVLLVTTSTQHTINLL